MQKVLAFCRLSYNILGHLKVISFKYDLCLKLEGWQLRDELSLQWCHTYENLLQEN